LLPRSSLVGYRRLHRLARFTNGKKRQAFEEVNRKEAAWVRYYKPSPGCAAAGQSIDCSNEFIRAKRAFEAQYRPGTQ
jgi:hypothetical protein